MKNVRFSFGVMDRVGARVLAGVGGGGSLVGCKSTLSEPNCCFAKVCS